MDRGLGLCRPERSTTGGLWLGAANAWTGGPVLTVLDL